MWPVGVPHAPLAMAFPDGLCRTNTLQTWGREEYHSAILKYLIHFLCSTKNEQFSNITNSETDILAYGYIEIDIYIYNLLLYTSKVQEDKLHNIYIILDLVDN